MDRMGTHTSTQIEVGARVMTNQDLPEGLKPGSKGIVVGQAGWIPASLARALRRRRHGQRARVRARAVRRARTLQARHQLELPRCSSSATASRGWPTRCWPGSPTCRRRPGWSSRTCATSSTSATRPAASTSPPSPAAASWPASRRRGSERALGRRRLLWGSALLMAAGVTGLTLGRTPVATVGSLLLAGWGGGDGADHVQALLADHHPEFRAVALTEANVVRERGLRDPRRRAVAGGGGRRRLARPAAGLVPGAVVALRARPRGARSRRPRRDASVDRPPAPARSTSPRR